jgi:hypothetical protein
VHFYLVKHLQAIEIKKKLNSQISYLTIESDVKIVGRQGNFAGLLKNFRPLKKVNLCVMQKQSMSIDKIMEKKENLFSVFIKN